MDHVQACLRKCEYTGKGICVVCHVITVTQLHVVRQASPIWQCLLPYERRAALHEANTKSKLNILCCCWSWTESSGPCRTCCMLCKKGPPYLPALLCAGQYKFNMYKKAGEDEPQAPKLVWPASVDRAAVTALIQASYLGRDMISTPANDMTPGTVQPCSITLTQQATNGTT